MSLLPSLMISSSSSFRLKCFQPFSAESEIQHPTEPVDASKLLSTSIQELVGVVDVTVQKDDDILHHLEGAEEYLCVWNSCAEGL